MSDATPIKTSNNPLPNKERSKLPRQRVPEQLAQIRAHNFQEVNLGFPAETARQEALRCIECPKPGCIEKCPVSVNVKAVIDLTSGNKPGDKPGAIAILHDITDLERLENVRKDFVANVSHEFRTPLAAIAGYSETLLDGAIEDRENNRRFLEIIRSNAIRLNSIASDLLTLSELQTGAGPQNTEQVPLGEAIESALSTIAAEAALRGVTVEKGPIDNLLVLGSRYRLEQALVNLLANAVKFNRPSGKVRVETRRNGTSIGILVSDTGVGIPSRDLPRIFERFYRVDKARSRQVGGTGLGLSIVKHIVERMNGRVSATSQLGKGSVFTITLPLA